MAGGLFGLEEFDVAAREVLLLQLSLQGFSELRLLSCQHLDGLWPVWLLRVQAQSGRCSDLQAFQSQPDALQQLSGQVMELQAGDGQMDMRSQRRRISRNSTGLMLLQALAQGVETGIELFDRLIEQIVGLCQVRAGGLQLSLDELRETLQKLL